MFKRQSNLYCKGSEYPFNISRSKIDLFLECPQCFYLDRKLGVARPDMPGWPLNSAVDQLLKNEFDLLRQNGQSHKLMDEYKINAIPFSHPDLKIWRDDVRKYVGASFFHKETNLNICGIIDDVWIDRKTKELYIVDYKATSTTRKISLEDEYKQGYKRQVEVYQWIFRKMGHSVSDTAYFVYANAMKDRGEFDGKLEFEVSIIPHAGDTSWIEPAILKIKECLDLEEIPDMNPNCKYCNYRKLVVGEKIKNKNSNCQ
jgi:hypothetical protein